MSVELTLQRVMPHTAGVPRFVGSAILCERATSVYEHEGELFLCLVGTGVWWKISGAPRPEETQK